MAVRPKDPEGPAAPVRLVLCMIVRDEAAVIGRCLESCLHLVDGYVLCDTGSIDGTPDLIAEVTRSSGLPGRIVSHPWRDFGHNRTLAAREAKAWVSARGWPLDRTYLLLLDADMVLHVAPSFDAQSLGEMAYTVEQDDGVIRYANTRLLRLSEEWEAVGRTHEFWRPVGVEIEECPLGDLLIEDRADGGSKAGKYERDIVLLRDALAAEPDNARYVFYLAQSFFDSSQWSEAAEWYGRRWLMGGWEEERWYARYREGVSMLALGEVERGAGTLLEAFAARPSRAEPLWALANHYRQAGKPHPALMFALQGLEIPYPQEDVLFIERHVYEWRLWEEVMISAIEAGPRYHDLAREACGRLLSLPGHEQWFHEYVAAWERLAEPGSETGGHGSEGAIPDDAAPRSERTASGVGDRRPERAAAAGEYSAVTRSDRGSAPRPESSGSRRSEGSDSHPLAWSRDSRLSMTVAAP